MTRDKQKHIETRSYKQQQTSILRNKSEQHLIPVYNILSAT